MFKQNQTVTLAPNTVEKNTVENTTENTYKLTLKLPATLNDTEHNKQNTENTVYTEPNIHNKQNNEHIEHNKQNTEWDQLLAEVEDGVIYDDDVEMYSTVTLSAVEQNRLSSNMSLEANVQHNNTILSNICQACGGRLLTCDNYMICQGCGQELQGTVVSTVEDECCNTTTLDSNVNNKGYMSVRVTGKGSYGLQRNLLKSCSDYSLYRKMTNRKEMHNWNSQSTGNQLPKHIIDEANDMFALIKEHGYVFRKDVKKGVQGACLYYICHMNGISKTPYEIAKLVGIAEKFLSAGDRILSDLNERGIIQISVKIDSIPSYVSRYFELLNIPNKYKKFVLDIIEQAENDKLHVLHDSKNNTKCIGAIYMLIERTELKNTISKERIETECGISKTTFIKYYAMLCKYYRRFVYIFAKHSIKLKTSWNEAIYDENNNVIHDVPCTPDKKVLVRTTRVSRVKKTD